MHFFGSIYLKNIFFTPICAVTFFGLWWLSQILILPWVGDLQIIAFQCQREHIYVGLSLIKRLMSIYKFDHNIFACNSLIEFYIPFYRLQILVSPKDWIAVHDLQAKCALYSFRMTNIYLKSYIMIHMIGWQLVMRHISPG